MSQQAIQVSHYKKQPGKRWQERQPLVLSDDQKKWIAEQLCHANKTPKHENTAVLIDLLARRYTAFETLKMHFFAGLSAMDDPNLLPDMEKAVTRLIRAMKRREIIAIETDHDADGVTAHAVIKESLTKIFRYPEKNIQSYIGHRLKEGYGLSDALADRILSNTPRPSLIITADNGSSDEARIARLKQEGIDVIVTDHHEIPDSGIPESAVAVISPARQDSAYPDRFIAGCMVACLFMASARQRIIQEGILPKDTPTLATVFDFVALGTVADCVSLSESKNNRLVIQHGLKRIAHGTRPAWRAIRPYLCGSGEHGTAEKTLRATDIAFGIAPRINARGRLDEAMAGVRFLLSENDDEAATLARLLDDENTARKTIEKTLKQKAIQMADAQIKTGRLSIVIYLEEGHPGVHGIVASRLTEKYGCPSIIFSPSVTTATAGEGVLSGSARGINGFHVRDALQTVHKQHPGLILKFGGHRGAAGLSIKKDNLADFQSAFERATQQQISAADVGPVIEFDGVLPYRNISLSFLKAFDRLEPFGREMPEPVFQADFNLIEIRQIGDGTHLRLTLGVPSGIPSGDVFTGIWFNALENPDDPLPVDTSDSIYRFLFSLNENVFRGQTTLQLMILDCRPIAVSE